MQENQFYISQINNHSEALLFRFYGQEIALQSGMGVSTNIKVRSRTLMSIFTDLFAKNAKNFKFIH
ncbi:hypothetical protein [Synechocystis sp. PCC 7509]|uniref:hypothetical protein n=1 Tax=Synechocystis sp. PCC 7509 TaxID=927677 RepID=UPI00030432A9|nr:hypothetical protein [Synechocystis sp. PCC 7509]